MTKRNHFGAFKPHTLTKHAVLDAYVKAWATILVRVFREVWFVDAFAGEGQDDEGNPGSPLIAARVAEQINALHFPKGITRHEGMRVVAFESDPDRFVALAEVMAPYTANPWHRGVAIVREGVLEDKLPKVLELIGSAPTLYFLDPFGIDGLSAPVLPELLRGPHNELLILFNDEGAVRLAGKVRAGAPDEEAALVEADASVSESLFGEAETERLRKEARDRVKRSVAGHKSNADAARIMDTAFGGDWWRPIIDATPEDRRQQKFVELYDQLLERMGGTKRLRFSVDTPDGRHKYYLIHASKDSRAYVAMKDAMHRARQKRQQESAFSQVLLEHIESESSIGPIADRVVQEFSGRKVRWQGVKPCVQEFALAETPLWRHEFAALQAEFARRGYTDLNEKGRPQSPLSFTFPATSVLMR